MGRPVRLVPTPTSAEGWAALRAGDLYEVPLEDRDVRRLHFGNAPEHAGKPQLVLVLPCGTRFCDNGPTWSQGKPGTAGWAVTGAPPALTVKPSVSIGGGWHGYVTDGVISDDVSGREFP